jgi:DNA-binding GntR family transcriptional regulator
MDSEIKIDEATKGSDLSALSEVAFSEIVDLIFSGKLLPGAVVNEVSLAKQFGMSRGPVREAVRRLQGRKLITRESFHRARVIELGLAQIVEIFQLREALEGMSCRLATQLMTDEALDRIIAILADNSESSYSREFDFHSELAASCGNERITDLLCNELYYLVRLYRLRSGTQPGRRSEARREHWQIARAMRARDADLAESLMRMHIRSATSELEKALGSSQAGATQSMKLQT